MVRQERSGYVLLQYNKTGFTLLEILIVLAIIGLFGTLIIPNLRSRLPRYEREEFIARLNAATQFAQEYAISNHALMQVFFDLKNRQVMVKAQEKITKKEPEFKIINGMRSKFTWPAQLEIRQLLIEGKDALKSFAMRGAGEVWFFITPQGYTQEVIINMIDKKDTINRRPRRVGLVLNPFSAQFKVYDSFQK